MTTFRTKKGKRIPMHKGHAKHPKKHSDAFRNTSGVLGNDSGPLTGADRVTEDRRLTSDTAIGTGTALTHKQKAFIGGKHRVTNTKGDGDRIL